MRMIVSLDKIAARLFAMLALAPLVPLVGCSGETGGGTGGNGGSGGGGIGLAACDGATSIEVLGQASGYEQCDGGWIHRPEIVTCPSAVPRADMCDPMGGTADCMTDADCTASPNGYCSGGEFEPGCFCRYGCVSDSECGAGKICVCANPVGHCTTASCTSDADCAGDALCSTYITEPGCGGFAYACQSPNDECASDSDCGANQQCTLANDHRVCADINCVIGRPFLVSGEARVAGVTERADWCETSILPQLDALTDDERRILASEWSRCAQMEHASIAAFARFAMQLLSVGAPPELLTMTYAAMADETEHARLCFALASAFAKRRVGPDKLAMDGAMDTADAAEIVRLAIVEGCIGETVASVEAAEGAARAVDPVVARVLAKIAEDEARHAELAFRFVKWAIASDERLLEVARDAFDTAIAETAAPIRGASSEDDEAWLRHGICRGNVKAELRRNVLNTVVAPAARAMTQMRYLQAPPVQMPLEHSL